MKFGAFLNRKSLTSGTTRTPVRSTTALSSASSLFKSVCLHDWWLIKPPEGEKGLAVAGFSSREGKSVRAFKSAAISRRLDATTLETADGFSISLVGFINKDLTQQNGFSSEVCSHFHFGFSYDWEEYTVKGSYDPQMQSHQESDCHILTMKAMEDLYEGCGLAKEFSFDTDALENSFQSESSNDLVAPRKAVHIDRHPESDHVLVPPTKRKISDMQVTEGSFRVQKNNDDSAAAHMTVSIETPRILRAEKLTGSRRITRSMTKEDHPLTRKSS